MSTPPVPSPLIESVQVEPWLRGTHTDTPAIGRAVLHALELAAEDIACWTEGLSDDEAHTQPLSLPSISFHLRHIARSVDRILTYAEGHQLTSDQLVALMAEQAGREALADLRAEVQRSLSNAAGRVRQLADADLETFCGVGRRHLPTSVGGALIHVADHTQRHTGQVITTAKVLRALRSRP